MTAIYAVVLLEHQLALLLEAAKLPTKSEDSEVILADVLPQLSGDSNDVDKEESTRGFCEMYKLHTSYELVNSHISQTCGLLRCVETCGASSP